jgi:ADP-ribose pyrophosphatase YjhB (NUDIX family)
LDERIDFLHPEADSMNHSTLNIPRIGVGCLVMDTSNQVLLVKRAHPPQQGFWHIPGGKLEWGESVGACAEREVLEETGLEIVPGPIIAVADRFIEGFHYVILDVLARVDTHSPPVSPSSDALDAVWLGAQCGARLTLALSSRKRYSGTLTPLSGLRLISIIHQPLEIFRHAKPRF